MTKPRKEKYPAGLGGRSWRSRSCAAFLNGVIPDASNESVTEIEPAEAKVSVTCNQNGKTFDLEVNGADRQTTTMDGDGNVTQVELEDDESGDRALLDCEGNNGSGLCKATGAASCTERQD